MTTTTTTSTQVQPYLFFEGRCEEALNHYKKAIGAKVTALMRYKESPDPQMVPPGGSEKVMHAEFSVADTVLFASDGRAQGKPSFQGFALSIAVPDEKTADRMFKGLEDGGQVMMPLSKTFFSPYFGMVTDKFGVTWMLIIPQQH